MQNKKIGFLCLLFTGFFFKFSQAQSPDVIIAYIAKYKDLAIEEMKRSGIPAAITLAQGIHETEAGTSDLVRQSNNHFGIKCKDNWTGESVSHDDDARGECFRKYMDPEASYRDHSDFLRSKSNYAGLFKLDPTDYEAWAWGLKKAGYATNPKYAQILIHLIEVYHLEDYTMIALNDMKTGADLAQNNPQVGGKNGKDIIPVSNKENNSNTVAASERPTDQKIEAADSHYPEGEFRINETRVIFVKKGMSYLAIARQYEVPLARLFEFNDMQQQDESLDDQLVFIQRKRKTGDHEFHVVQRGETLNAIAQKEAIRLESLLEYNNLGSSMQPAVGETLYLRARSPSTPRLAVSNTMLNR